MNTLFDTRVNTHVNTPVNTLAKNLMSTLVNAPATTFMSLGNTVEIERRETPRPPPLNLLISQRLAVYVYIHAPDQLPWQRLFHDKLGSIHFMQA